MSTSFETLLQLRSRPELLDQVREHPGDSLQLQSFMRKNYPAELVRAALLLTELRTRAAGKFESPESLWCDRVGFEQASAWQVARHKAARFDQLAPAGPVWDLCCGIGGDAMQLARVRPVVAVDRDPAHCLMTRWNCEQAQLHHQVVCICADVSQLMISSQSVHLDPDRRQGRQGRARRLEQYEPSLEFLQQLAERGRAGAIKLGPAANFGGKFPGCELELISLDGECKEATVWFGELAAGGEIMRATVLPSGETIAADPLSAWPEQGSLGRYLYDPDPAVVRSNLVDVVAHELMLQRLDAEEEYLTADTLADSPFVTAFEVLAEFPNNDKQLRRYFREQAYGDAEIKCRHVRVQSESLRRKLALSSGPRATVFVARIAGRVRMIVARRVTDRPARDEPE